MKKFCAATLAAVATLSLAACGSSDGGDSSATATTSIKSGLAKQETMSLGQTIHLDEALTQQADIDISVTNIELSDSCFQGLASFSDPVPGATYLRLTGDVNVKAAAGGNFTAHNGYWVALNADNKEIAIDIPTECQLDAIWDKDWNSPVGVGTSRTNVSEWRLAERPAKLQFRDQKTLSSYETDVYTWEIPAA